MEKMSISRKAAEEFEWDKWTEEIPYLKFPPEWKVKAVPPFAGAVIRYFVTLDGIEDRVSIYLDCYDMLGYYGRPYWEVYPYDGDTYRCDMVDTKSLIKAIGESLELMKESAKE